jgi:hypothetical protein
VQVLQQSWFGKRRVIGGSIPAGGSNAAVIGRNVQGTRLIKQSSPFLSTRLAFDRGKTWQPTGGDFGSGNGRQWRSKFSGESLLGQGLEEHQRDAVGEVERARLRMETRNAQPLGAVLRAGWAGGVNPSAAA